jgi:hypothetical protein
MLLELALTDVAFDLLKIGPGSRPREIVLRRSVSSAYYAVFHALCRLCADELVGVTAPIEDRTLVYRSVEHRLLRELRRNPRLSATAQNILAQAVTLQEKRHLADYDPRPQKFGGRAAVLSLAGSAEDVVAEIGSLPPAERKTLAVMLAVARKGR